MNAIIESSKQLVIRQVKEWAEILINFETKNKYELQSLSGQKLGYIVERDNRLLGTLARLFLRSHRPLDIDILDNHGKPVFHLSRKFFFFFSDSNIADAGGQKLGGIHRRFGIIHMMYDLCDKDDNVFAHVRSPFWRLWTFPIKNRYGKDAGVISKKWQGLLREAFTDADSFVVDYSDASWMLNKKSSSCALLSASILISLRRTRLTTVNPRT